MGFWKFGFLDLKRFVFLRKIILFAKNQHLIEELHSFLQKAWFSLGKLTFLAEKLGFPKEN